MRYWLLFILLWYGWGWGQSYLEPQTIQDIELLFTALAVSILARMGDEALGDLWLWIKRKLP